MGLWTQIHRVCSTWILLNAKTHQLYLLWWRLTESPVPLVQIGYRIQRYCSSKLCKTAPALVWMQQLIPFNTLRGPRFMLHFSLVGIEQAKSHGATYRLGPELEIWWELLTLYFLFFHKYSVTCLMHVMSPKACKFYHFSGWVHTNWCYSVCCTSSLHFQW